MTQILECLEQFDLGNADAGFSAGAGSTLHVMVESIRLPFSGRSVWMGDQEFVDSPLAGLTSADYQAARCAQISTDLRIAAGELLPGDPRALDSAFAVDGQANISNAADGAAGVDTTHFSVIDIHGNVVSWTSTIDGTWGRA